MGALYDRSEIEAELAAMPLTKNQKAKARELLAAEIGDVKEVRLHVARAKLHAVAPNWAGRLDGMAVARLLRGIGFEKNYARDAAPDSYIRFGL